MREDTKWDGWVSLAHQRHRVNGRFISAVGGGWGYLKTHIHHLQGCLLVIAKTEALRCAWVRSEYPYMFALLHFCVVHAFLPSVLRADAGLCSP